MKLLYRYGWVIGCALGVAACSNTPTTPSSSNGGSGGTGDGGSGGSIPSASATGTGGGPTAAPAESVDEIKTDSDYESYTSVAVNNGHFALRDEHDQLHVAWIDQAGTPVVGTRSAAGEWKRQALEVHAAGSKLKNPNLMQRGDDFIVGWMERDGDQSHLVVADGLLQSPSADPAHVWTTRRVTSIPYTDMSTEPKYLSMSLTAKGPLFGFTEGMPDVQARVIGDAGELSMSPFKSGLFTFIKSSDVTLDSAGDFAVVVWEENWSDPQFGPGKDANLLFITSSDGGSTWTAPAHLLGSGPTPGGDPSVYCTEDGTMYIAFHVVEKGSLGGIYAARRLPGETHFSVIEAPGLEPPGRIGSGWLPAIDGLPDRFAVSWEQTDGEYMVKHEHRVAVAYVSKANTTPAVTFGPITDSSPQDATSYDLAANISLADDGVRVDVFWMHVDAPTETNVTLNLMHRVDLATEGTATPAR